MQNLLLVLGTALVAVAVTVFAAVNWSRLDASAQGLVLVGLTAIAAASARAAARHEMPATAEAVGVVALLMALADVHALRVGAAPNVDRGAFWAVGLAGVSVAAWSFGARTRVRSTRIAAWVLGQLPLYLLVRTVAAGSWEFAGAAVLVQAAAVATLARRCRREPRWARILGVGVAVAAASLVVVAAAVVALLANADEVVELRDAAGLLALAALVSGYAAWLWAADGAVRAALQVSATVLGLGALHAALRSSLSAEASLAGVALVAASVAMGACRVPSRWGRVPGVAGAVGAAMASTPLLYAMASMLVAGSEAAAAAGDLPATVRAADLRLEAEPGLSPLVVLAHLGAVAVLAVVVAWQIPRRWAAWIGATVVAAALVVAPLLVPLSIGGVVASGVLAAVGALAAAGTAAVGERGRRAAFAFAVGGYGWAVLWALASTPLTIATLWAGAVLAAVLAGLSARDELEELAMGGVAASVVLSCAATAVSSVAAGAALAVGWGLAAAVAATASVLGALVLDPSGTDSGVRGRLGRAQELAALVVHLVALAQVVGATDSGALSVVLGSGAMALLAHGMRPGRRVLVVFAGVEALLLTWLRLDVAEVQLVEAYSLPLAALLGAVGWYAHRAETAREAPLASWVWMGPALVVAFAPTVGVVLAEPEGLRPLVVLVAGAAILVAGAWSGRRAPVDIASACVAVVGLRLAVPAVATVPNWVVIGATGIALLAVGATFEQRRADLRAARRRYSALR